MDHTINDYLENTEMADCNNLVTSPPEWIRRPAHIPFRVTNPDINISNGSGDSLAEVVTPPPSVPAPLQSIYNHIQKNYNPQLCNEVTITFTDKWLRVYKTSYIQQQLKDWLYNKSVIADYILIQDYSHTGRLHYHGIFEMRKIDEFARLITNLQRKFGRVECKQITYWESYIRYMLGLYDPSHDKFCKAIEWTKQRYLSSKLI